MSSITSTESEAVFNTPPARTRGGRRSTLASPPGGGGGTTGEEDTPTRSERGEEEKQAETPATDDDAPLPAITESLPSYLLRIVSRFESINLEDVTEEAKEKGDG